jgi:phage terminase large subunit-like protein
VDPESLPVIYEAEQGADWLSETVWAQANPNLGVSISLDYLRKEFAKARRLPRYENSVRRLHLNQWTEQACRWITLESWDANAGELPHEELRTLLKGRACYGGMDLATTTDLAALSLVFPPAEGTEGRRDEGTKEGDDRWFLLRWAWLPRESAESRSRGEKSREAPYEQWGRQGLIELTPGNVIDYGAIRRRIVSLAGEYDLRELGYDPYSAEYLCNQQLGGEDGLPVAPVRQGYLSMSPPSKLFEQLVLGGKLIHGNDPVLRWAAAHVTVRQDANENLMPDKKSSKERIDPIVATIIALARAMVQGGVKKSIYDDRPGGLMSF